MDGRFIRLLSDLGFTKTHQPRGLGETIVVHAVAGAGKTTLLRQALRELPDISVCTTGLPDNPNLTLDFIKGQAPPIPGKFNVLDEYPARASWPTEEWQVLIADNLQHSGPAAKPHYVCNVTRRFGSESISFLRQLGFSVEAHPDLDDSDKGFSLTPIWGEQLFGQVITLDKRAQDVLDRYHVPYLCALETRGLEFPVVTIVSTNPLDLAKDKCALWVALTRHTKVCHVRAPPLASTP